MEKNTAIELINKLLQSQGMKSVSLDTLSGIGSVLENNRIYIDFRKSSLYVVNLIDADHVVELEEQSRLLRHLFTQRKISADHIFILHLLLSDGSRREEDIHWRTPEMEDSIIEICWMVDYNSEKLQFPENQPTSFLNLEKDLAAALHHKQIASYAMGNPGKVNYVSYGFILFHLFIWIAEEHYGGSRQIQTLLQMGAMNVFLILDGQWFRFVTAMFLHIGLSHLLMNLAGIYIFGSRLEKQISGWEMILIYLAGGILGNIVSFGYHFWMNEIYVVAAGASGGVYGLMGGLLAVTYFTKKKAEGLDAYAILIYFLIGIIVSAIDIQIDLAAHLGGFVAGFITTSLLIQKRKRLI